MSAASVAFFASALLCLGGAGYAVTAHRLDRALAAFAVSILAAAVPLVQLGAGSVAALVVLAGAGVLGLLAGVDHLARATARTQSSEVDTEHTPSRARPWTRARPWSYWVLAGSGVAALIWVLLATGSRQVVEAPEPPRGFAESSQAAWLSLGSEGAWLWPSTVVALLALCAVLAGVLSMVSPASGEGGR